MTDYGLPLQFGLFVIPQAVETERAIALVQVAEENGLDLIAIQDHPYLPDFLDTWTLMAFLAAQTRRIRFFPDVANLALRPPAMLAKAAASLDRLSGGRIELGLGSGGFWDAIAGMGGPRLSPAEAVAATEEAIQVIRLAWESGEEVSFAGSYYPLHGHKPGPRPAHPMGIWLGVRHPRMLALTGRRADGWACPLNTYVPPREVPAMQARIDESAQRAGRAPTAIRRIYNVMGGIDAEPGRPGGLSGAADQWAETLAHWATDLGFDTFIFYPSVASPAQVERFAREVMPRTRELVAQTRGMAH